MRVPQVDFKSMNFAHIPQTTGGMESFYKYTGPQTSVKAVAEASMTSSMILDIQAPFPNSTWSLDFHGPTLICGKVDEESYKSITDNILANCDASYGYIAWTPSSSADDRLPLNNGSLVTPGVGLGPSPISEDPLSLYVAALPNMLNAGTVPVGANSSECTDPLNSMYNYTLDKRVQSVSGATIAQCILGNASYVANISFTNNIQSIYIRRGQIYNNVSYVDSVGGASLLAASNGQGYNTSLVETLAYQAVMNAFNSLLLGGIYNTYEQVNQVDTTMGMTALQDTIVSFSGTY